MPAWAALSAKKEWEVTFNCISSRQLALEGEREEGEGERERRKGGGGREGGCRQCAEVSVSDVYSYIIVRHKYEGMCMIITHAFQSKQSVLNVSLRVSRCQDFILGSFFPFTPSLPRLHAVALWLQSLARPVSSDNTCRSFSFLLFPSCRKTVLQGADWAISPLQVDKYRWTAFDCWRFCHHYLWPAVLRKGCRYLPRPFALPSWAKWFKGSTERFVVRLFNSWKPCVCPSIISPYIVSKSTQSLC